MGRRGKSASVTKAIVNIFDKFGIAYQFDPSEMADHTRGNLGSVRQAGFIKKYRHNGKYQITSEGVSYALQAKKWGETGLPEVTDEVLC